MEKICIRCGAHFTKPAKLSKAQWDARQYCSKRCSGLKHKPYTDSEIAAMYATGLSSSDISLEAGISARMVLAALHRSGAKIRPATEAMKLSHNKPEVRAKFAAIPRKPCPEHVRDALRDLIGQKNPNWKGGITRDAAGYLCYTRSKANGPNAGKHVHRVVAEAVIGRPLRKGEVVHHKDHNKLNNDPANLQVMLHSEHARLHANHSGLGKKEKDSE
jgi:hypothetical protein